MSAPPVVVLRMLPDAIPVIANDEDVAAASVVLPVTVSVEFALSAPPTFKIEEMVVEPVTASAVVVAPPAATLRPPLRVARPVTPRVDESVAAPVTASV